MNTAYTRKLSFLLDIIGITVEPDQLAKESKRDLKAAEKWASAYRRSALYSVKVPKKPKFLKKYEEPKLPGDCKQIV